MAKTSIYLPDDLAEQVRAHGIPVSEVAQAALRQALKDIQLKEDAMTDLQAVAERLRDTRRQAAEKSQAEDQRVHDMGAKWARIRATAADLEYVATFDGEADAFHVPDSLFYLIMDDAWKDVPRRPGADRWAHFQAGAREVWEAVQPLLIELDDHGETLPPGSGGYSETVNPAYRLWLEREPAPEAPLAEFDRWKAEEPKEFL
jgi:post-segregation antitoxin (ccd killing protein)